MRIALITIHNANNYGAMMQLYAMQQVLSRYGETEVIDYVNAHHGNHFTLVRIGFSSINSIKAMLIDLGRIVPRYQAIRRFRSFIDSCIRMSPAYSRDDLVAGKASDYDCYVAGSDQIWNPRCVSADNSIDPTYFLDFAPASARRIAFSSSAGGHVFDEREQQVVRTMLADFSSIAVRESTTRDRMQAFLGREIHHTLDPTLLFTAEEWRHMMPASVIDAGSEPYILVYTVPRVSLIRDAAAYAAQESGYKVVSLEQGLNSGAEVDRQVRNAGPAEFIELFSKAAFVVTDSFHGSCFSLIFRKPFIAISHGNEGKARVLSLLNAVGLEDRFVAAREDLEGMPMELDFSEANVRLEALRQRSLAVLDDALSQK